MLLSGVDNHVAGLGTMDGDATEAQRGQPGYEMHLNFRVVTFAKLLQDAGYHTFVTGKWDMGDGWVKHVTVWVDGLISTYWTFDDLVDIHGNFSPERDDG